MDKLIVKTQPSFATKIKEWLITGCWSKNYINGLVDCSAKKYILTENVNSLKKCVLTRRWENGKKTTNLLLVWLSMGNDVHKSIFKELFIELIVSYNDLCLFSEDLLLIRGSGSIIKKTVQKWFETRLISTLIEEVKESSYPLLKMLKAFHIKPTSFNLLVLFKNATKNKMPFMVETPEKYVKNLMNHLKDNEEIINKNMAECLDLFTLYDSIARYPAAALPLDYKLEKHYKPKSKICFIIDRSSKHEKVNVVLSALISEKDYYYEYVNGELVLKEEIPSIIEFPRNSGVWIYPRNGKIIDQLPMDSNVICIIGEENRWPKFNKNEEKLKNKKIIYIYSSKAKIDISNYNKEDYVFKGYKLALRIIPSIF